MSVTLPAAGPVEVAVFDALGRRVVTLAEGVLGEGEHTLRWNASGVALGVYVVRVVAGGGTRATRVSVVR